MVYCKDVNGRQENVEMSHLLYSLAPNIPSTCGVHAG